jgi:hypothetical protein
MLICYLDSGEFELASALPDANPNNGFPPYRQSGQSILVGDHFYLLPGTEFTYKEVCVTLTKSRGRGCGQNTERID